MNGTDFLLSPQAHADLISIYDYIAQDNPAAASLLLSRFDRAFRLLAAFPKIGTPLKPQRPDHRMVFPVRGYRIIYRPTSSARTGIEVLRVYHGARDISLL
jgi:toxin ParE1/3/4